MPVNGDQELLHAWTSRLRWGLVVVLAASLPVSAGPLGLDVKWAVAVPILAVLVAANVVGAITERRGRRLGGWVSIGGVVLDMAAVAGVLAASGGAANPFTALLFVHVALAASMMATRTAFLVAGFGALSFGALFLLPESTSCHVAASSSFEAHLYGMWAAYAVGAALVTLVSTTLRRALESRARQVSDLQERAEAAARFASVGTLAAGTAHELGTPLGTIAILAAELEEAATTEEAQGHARAIRGQIDRCREVLRRMQPGATRIESPSEGADLDEVLASSVAAWQRAHPTASVALSRSGSARVPLAAGDLTAAIDVLLDNAWHATRAAKSDEPIRVEVAHEASDVVVRVRDAGVGFEDDAPARLGEPFYTTKSPGEGMGLGLFLIRTLIQQAGGQLEASRVAPHGAVVALRLRDLSAAR